MKNNKTLEIINVICDMVFVICGILGFALNLVRIDDLVMNHFGWFIVMNVVYLTMFVLGWIDLSHMEE